MGIIMREVYIFGAGRYGEMAYIYYENKYDIRGFVDNNIKKQGELLRGREIYMPCILHDKKECMIIVAVSNINTEKAILKQLMDEYNIKGVMLFRISDEPYMLSQGCDDCGLDEQLIVNFRSGLGNQMFQYAVYKFLLNNGKNVYADLSDYIYLTDAVFSLDDTFANVLLRKSNPKLTRNYRKRHYYGDKLIEYDEPGAESPRQEIKVENFLKMSVGYINGYHQTYKFADAIRNDLLSDFEFNIKCEKKLCEMAQCFNEDNWVGIHIRRGDYLNEGTLQLFGNICTNEYYRNAMDYIKSRIPDCRFVFFSNDIEWVKENLQSDSSYYIEEGLFEDYQDWYDMCLMSKCRHNIIANSSFSWWGAWLNQNPDKIVIAPKTWANVDSFKDICPPDWIRI
jgi:hypothetical protein